MTDPRKPKGLRHKFAGFLTLIALAVAAGCQGPHAIAEFAHSLNHGQRRHLRCRPRKGTRAQFDVPSERTFRRLLKRVDSDQLKNVLVGWMRGQDPAALKVVHFDGKVLKNAQPAPVRPPGAASQSAAPTEPCEIPASPPRPHPRRGPLHGARNDHRTQFVSVSLFGDFPPGESVPAHRSQTILTGF
jgi:hypothetical protein